MPASRAARMTASDWSWSMRIPKLFAPSPATLTVRPPSRRCSMSPLGSVLSRSRRADAQLQAPAFLCLHDDVAIVTTSDGPVGARREPLAVHVHLALAFDHVDVGAVVRQRVLHGSVERSDGRRTGIGPIEAQRHEVQ